jgi:hypothetical protein
MIGGVAFLLLEVVGVALTVRWIRRLRRAA